MTAAVEEFANDPQAIVISGGTDAPAPGTVQNWTVLVQVPFSGPPFHGADPEPGMQTEKIRVTSGSGAVGTQSWQVVRGDEGTTPLAHGGGAGGWVLRDVVTAGWYNAVRAALTKTLAFSLGGTASLTTGDFRLYNDTPAAWTILGVRASAGTAPTGASLIVDVLLNGTTIFSNPSNRPTIAASANTSGNATGMSTTTVPAGDYLTVNIAQIGSSVAGSDLVVQVEVV